MMCILYWTISVAASDNPGGRLTSDIPISKPSLRICWRTSTATPFASSPSTSALPIASFGFKIGPQQKQAEEPMRGVVFTGERGLELMQFPDPTPETHDVVIEMKASGMCGSDLHQYRRPRGQSQATGIPMNEGPVIVGHDPCGVVIEGGIAVDAKMARIGHRVMVHHYQGCTQCNHCRSGWPQLCPELPVKAYATNAHRHHP